MKKIQWNSINKKQNQLQQTENVKSSTSPVIEADMEIKIKLLERELLF